jgi:cell division protein FtsL
MRILMVFVAIIIYLFLLVFLESELVKIEVRMEELRSRVAQLRSHRKQMESDLLDIANLANIETAAKAMGFSFPEQDDILGVVE